MVNLENLLELRREEYNVRIFRLGWNRCYFLVYDPLGRTYCLEGPT